MKKGDGNWLRNFRVKDSKVNNFSSWLNARTVLEPNGVRRPEVPEVFRPKVFGKALVRGQGCQNEYLVSPHPGKEFPLMEAILGV